MPTSTVSIRGSSGLPDPTSILHRHASAYGVLAATPDTDHEHTDVIHGTRVYLIDPAGMLVTSYDLSVPKEDMLSDVRAILKS